MTTFRIRKRHRKRGWRYEARFHTGGADGTWIGLGTFVTRREAEDRLRWAREELAAGRFPTKERAEARPEVRTVAEILADLGKRHTGESSRKKHRQTTARLGRIAGMDATEISGRQIQELFLDPMAGELRSSSIAQYLRELRRAFDYAEISPNPARWQELEVWSRLDEDGDLVDPPRYVEFEAIVAELYRRRAKQYGVVAEVLEGTGLRISELIALRWGDVDFAGRRIRVAKGRTKRRTGGVRWVPLLDRIADLLEAELPLEDRDLGAEIFPGLTRNNFDKALRRAWKHLGMPARSPHQLRHRFISILVAAQLPWPLVSEIAGHKRRSITFDTYAHVLLREPESRLREFRQAVGRMHGFTEEREPSPETTERLI